MAVVLWVLTNEPQLNDNGCKDALEGEQQERNWGRGQLHAVHGGSVQGTQTGEGREGKINGKKGYKTGWGAHGMPA